MNYKLLIIFLILIVSPITAQSKSKLIFTFDDYTSAVGADYIKQTLSNNGQRGVVFVVTNHIDSTELTKLKQLQSMGWDVSSHTASHAKLSTLTLTELDKELMTSNSWLKNNGFTSGSRFIAYPNGAYTTNVLEYTKKYYALGRTIDIGINPATGYDKYKLKRLLSSNYPTSVSTHKTAIDNLISQGGIGIFAFHGVVLDNPETYTYKLSDFQQISAYAKSKQDAGLLEVVTLSDIVSPLPTPSPSPTPIKTPTPTPTQSPTPTPTPIPPPPSDPFTELVNYLIKLFASLFTPQ